MSWTLSHYLTKLLQNSEKAEAWVSAQVTNIGYIKVFMIFAVIFAGICWYSETGAFLAIGLVVLPKALKRFNAHLEDRIESRYDTFTAADIPVIGAVFGAVVVFLTPAFKQILGWAS